MRTVSASELRMPPTSFNEAVRVVSSLFESLPPRHVPLRDALGLVAACDVVAEINVPGFDNSSMDGFAVRADDFDGTSVAPAAHIATGSPLPQGADTVVPWENAAERDGRIYLDSIDRGQYVRATGHDVRRGSIVARAGTVLGPVHLGVLASIGVSEVQVIPQPDVAVLVSGDEVVSPGAPLGEFGVYDVNSTLVPALLALFGAHVTGVVRVGDDPDETTGAMKSLSSMADLVVTTGGASVGERDWVREVLTKNGALALWRVAMRPGKPFAAGRFDGTPVLTLPGNPGSVLACSHGFVARAVRKLSGRSVAPRTQTGRLICELENDEPRTFICPVAIEGDDVVPLAGETSQGIAHATGGVGFVIVPPSSVLSRGTHVEVEF